MNRPNVRALLKDLPLGEVTSMVEEYVNVNPEKEFYLANIDLLRLYGKGQRTEDFYKLALFLSSSIRNPAIFREVARYAYFIEKDSEKAKHYANNAIKENGNEPLWVYYIARQSKNYFEKLTDRVYLTAIPKNASTSLKTMILEEVHQKKGLNPHSVFGNPFFSSSNFKEELTEEDLKLISIREPVSRFVSYYNKNVIEESSLHEELNFTNKDNAYGLPLKPTLDYFIDNLNLYCYMFNDVLHHILPQTAYFVSLKEYDCAVDIKEAHKLGEAVSQKLNLVKKISPPKKMVSTKKVSTIKISKASEQALLNLFRDDVFAYKHMSIENKKYSFDF
ncbi:sulfotransferase family 2 domain-containing protein [Vibrio astriarenae]